MERTPSATKASSPERWLDEHGDALFRYAYMRLRDRDAAEDAVQETLVAALTARKNFAGNSAERTWLIGILKHKLADHWRRVARTVTVDTLPDADDPDELLERFFDPANRDHWRVRPPAWSDPDAALEDKQFWGVLAECLAAPSACASSTVSKAPRRVRSSVWPRPTCGSCCIARACGCGIAWNTTGSSANDETADL
jgi:RNA polymerase sigma-70 factor (TIGR02943 family)